MTARPPKPASSSGPSRNTVVLAFGIAIAAAVALVAVALLSRNESTTEANPTPVVNLEGIPQQGTVLGPPEAKVTLIEYADIQCPACRYYLEEFLPTVVDEYVRPGTVNMEFRGYPFIGEDSFKAQRFLLAAAEQNRLWQLTEALYRHQGGENDGWVTDDLIRELASQIPGMDVDRLFARANTDELDQAAQQAADDAVSAGIRGTPTLLVKIGDGAPYEIQVATPDQMREALDAALQD
jgi:protein-disulfide isomerase